MIPATAADPKIEATALRWTIWASLFMALAGFVAAGLSNSQAVLMDGAFSLIGAASVWAAQRVSARVGGMPDRLRPLGYAAEEAIFITFRSLLLLGLLMFAGVSSLLAIVAYIGGDAPEPLQFDWLLIYFAVVGVTCLALWGGLNWAWRRTGQRSDILRLEAKAAAYDTLMTALPAVGLALIWLMQDGPLAFIVPIGDRILVLLLCGFAVAQYARDFLRALGELAGSTAPPDTIAQLRRALRDPLAEAKVQLVDFSVTKLGRSHLAALYVNPETPMSAAQSDALFSVLQARAQAELPGTQIWITLSAHDRSWPGVEATKV